VLFSSTMGSQINKKRENSGTGTSPTNERLSVQPPPPFQVMKPLFRGQVHCWLANQNRIVNQDKCLPECRRLREAATGVMRHYATCCQFFGHYLGPQIQGHPDLQAVQDAESTGVIRPRRFTEYQSTRQPTAGQSTDIDQLQSWLRNCHENHEDTCTMGREWTIRLGETDELERPPKPSSQKRPQSSHWQNE
jgi:hypothetical protein